MHQFPNREGFPVEVHLVGLQFGKLEQVGNQFLQVVTILIDDLQVLLTLLTFDVILF